MLDRVTAADGLAAGGRGACAATPAPTHAVRVDLFASGSTGRASCRSLDPDAVRMILYTSGTTGRPKGVLHTP